MGDPQYLPMKKNIWKLTAILICIGILINILSFKISADGTYKETSYQTLIIGNKDYYGYELQIGIPRYQLFNNTAFTGKTDLRYTYGYTDTEKLYIYLVSLSAFTPTRLNISYDSGQSTGTSSTNSTSITIDNTTYYVMYGQAPTDATYTPLFNDTLNNTIANTGNLEKAVYYTYGDGADEIEYGELIISYKQNIYTEHPENNLDMISWNAYMDTAGNDLQGKNIEIQAIAGYFEGSSYADLKQTRFSDWLASTHPAVTMYKGTIEISHQEYNWGTVASNFRSINTLGTWFWNIFTNEGTWYQYGWRYQARLLDEDLEPLTEWQLIYTGNSYSPSATEILTDDEPLTPDDVDTINDINDENGTTNNWYINNTVITNNEYNQTYQQNIIENIYNILQGTPDDGLHNKAEDVQQTIDNAIDTEDDYLNDLQTQLNDLELNDITQNNGLMKALRWVREVHHETIETTVFGPIVLTIMLIGLITYLIGRRNG